jgi:hypothetical protein
MAPIPFGVGAELGQCSGDPEAAGLQAEDCRADLERALAGHESASGVPTVDQNTLRADSDYVQ